MDANTFKAALPAHSLAVLNPNAGHTFKVPVKCINDGEDVAFFLASKAYADIMTFIFQLNTAMLPRKSEQDGEQPISIKEWTLEDADVTLPPVVQELAKLLHTLGTFIDEAPPDPGPRRFGNLSFRKWSEIVKERVPDLLDQHVSSSTLSPSASSEVPAKAELEAYLIGSFGSSQRLDYGTGHELSFLAFLGCLWKLGAFPESNDGHQERAIVLGVIEPYLQLIRRLILIYTLEPAGSHGVWGLDDHSFVPYILGSAQFSPPFSSPTQMATEGSLPNAPHPGDVAKANAVDRERRRNMYFSAIGFIYDVKKGPFWEHSPILYDISGVKAGWAKINKGMLKMYNAEVLSKFPVVQHFPFGSMFAWERDPTAREIQASVHTSSQPKSTPPAARPQTGLRDALSEPGAPNSKAPMSGTAAPWATSRIPVQAQGPSVPSGPNQPTRAPWASSTPASQPPGSGVAAGVVTAAPWAKPGASAASTTRGTVPSTRAPWADRKPPS